MDITPPQELDPLTAPEFDEVLRSVDPADHLVIDFSEVEFCDSSGVRVLLDAYKRHEDAGGSFRIVDPRPQMRRVLELTDLYDRLVTSRRDDSLSL